MWLHTKKSIAQSAAKRWKHQYGSEWPRNTKRIYEQLSELGDDIAPKQVEEIIGNKSWTENFCGECGSDAKVTVLLGQEPDYASDTMSVCLSCLTFAVVLAKKGYG